MHCQQRSPPRASSMIACCSPVALFARAEAGAPAEADRERLLLAPARFAVASLSLSLSAFVRPAYVLPFVLACVRSYASAGRWSPHLAHERGPFALCWPFACCR